MGLKDDRAVTPTVEEEYLSDLSPFLFVELIVVFFFICFYSFLLKVPNQNIQSADFPYPRLVLVPSCWLFGVNNVGFVSN